MDMVRIESNDLIWLKEVIRMAIENGQDVHFAVDGGLKVKRGGSIWTVPFGTVYKRG